MSSAQYEFLGNFLVIDGGDDLGGVVGQVVPVFRRTVRRLGTSQEFLVRPGFGSGHDGYMDMDAPVGERYPDTMFSSDYLGESTESRIWDIHGNQFPCCFERVGGGENMEYPGMEGVPYFGYRRDTL